MAEDRRFHIELLRKAIDQLQTFRSRRLTADDPSFAGWQRRVTGSLEFTLGEEHTCTSSFSALNFRQLGGPIPFDSDYVPGWDAADQSIFERDLALAEEIIADALDELDALGLSAGSGKRAQVKRAAPSIVRMSHSPLNADGGHG